MRLHNVNGSYEIPLMSKHHSILGSLGRSIYQELDDSGPQYSLAIDYLVEKELLETVDTFITGKGSVVLYRLSDMGLQAHQEYSARPAD